MTRTSWRLGALALAAALSLAGPTQAAELLSGFGPDGQYGEIALLPNDDDSSSLLNLPFEVNFFGRNFSSFYVNNNGNITFAAPLSEFTPTVFPVANQPMIAPWWADVDTRTPGSGTFDGGNGGGEVVGLALTTVTVPYAGANNVYVGSPNADTLVVTWDQVGYFAAKNDKINTFQLVLNNRSDIGAGNFDIQFRYKQLQWTTGDASNGLNGLGGTPAQAGYDDGLGVNHLSLPGSFSNAVLDLANTSNVGPDTPGLWVFEVRNTTLPPNTPETPLLPEVVDGNYVFDFNVQPQQTVFIDPDVAVGYNYTLQSDVASQSFASVVLSTNVGDGLYDIYVWNGTDFALAQAGVAAGQTYTFASGVTRFSVRGIETTAALDPNDTLAFVTGVTFTEGGRVEVTQSPLLAAVPEPQSYALMLGGLAALGAFTRRQRRRQTAA